MRCNRAAELAGYTVTAPGEPPPSSCRQLPAEGEKVGLDDVAVDVAPAMMMPPKLTTCAAIRGQAPAATESVAVPDMAIAEAEPSVVTDELDWGMGGGGRGQDGSDRLQRGNTNASAERSNGPTPSVSVAVPRRPSSALSVILMLAFAGSTAVCARKFSVQCRSTRCSQPESGRETDAAGPTVTASTSAKRPTQAMVPAPQVNDCEMLTAGAGLQGRVKER